MEVSGRKESSSKKYAFFLALFYFLVSALWIHFSTHLARLFASDLVQMELIETWKGYGWMLLTSLLILTVSFFMFRHIEASGAKILRSQQELANSERHAFAGMIASSVAHDFNNILMILRVSADRLLQEPNLSTGGQANARRIDDNLQRLADLSQRLRNVSKLRIRSLPCAFDISQTVQETINLVSLHERLEGCTVRFESRPESIQVDGYPILIHQMVMNLMLNAADATAGQGAILVTLEELANRTVLRVDDDGPGVAEELKGKIFEAFYTTKKSGSGLGLVSVQECVHAHRGSIRLEPSDLGGASFIFELPHHGLSRG